jgi:CRP-like cAMP-binding protein
MTYLLHVANALYLLSYSVKDILWLRVLTVVAGGLLLGRMLADPAPSHAAIAWNILFTLINLYRISLLILERRPVRFKEDEQRLYQLVFRSLTPREFVKLLAIGSWEEAPASRRIVSKGENLDRIRVVYSGRTEVQIEGRTITSLGEGKFIGEMSFLTGDKPTADVVAVEPTRVLAWQKNTLKTFLGDNPELRAAIQLIIGTDLVGKLRAG